MKKFRSSLFVLAVVASLLSPFNLKVVQAADGWSLNSASSESDGLTTFTFTLTNQSPYSLQVGDSLAIFIFDESGEAIGTDSQDVMTDGQSEVVFTVDVDTSALQEASRGFQFPITVSIAPADTAIDPFTVEFSYAQVGQGANVQYQFADFLRYSITNPTTLTYPNPCEDIAINYSLADPNALVQGVILDLLDGEGDPVTSESVEMPDVGSSTQYFTICQDDLESSYGPYEISITLDFGSDYDGPDVVDSLSVGFLPSVDSIPATLKAMGAVCQKSGKYAVARSGKCPKGYSAQAFTKPTTNQFTSLGSNPISMKAKNFILYGCVTDIDTENNAFISKSYWKSTTMYYDLGISTSNSISATGLSQLSKGDTYITKANVKGSRTYSTVDGQVTSASLTIRDLVKTGRC